MASILLSFVGQQDPVSDNTHEDGSIVTLLRHLVAQGQTIQSLVLLYTEGTRERAELTQGWLEDSPFHLPGEAIALIPVEAALSQDPVNLLLAVQAARHGLEVALAHSTSPDTLEFNASSGTPVMKSAWGILQAAGYAPRSRIWQVRNPKEMQPGQERVFQTNVDTLRQEFDVQVIKQQLRDYNYSGALATLQASGLQTPLLAALMQYGHRRLSLDFKGAQGAIAPLSAQVDRQWVEEITALEQRQPQALLQEAYFNAVVELKNKKFSDFLVRVSQFQEQALQYWVNQHLRRSLPTSFDETQVFWQALSQDHPDLYQFLEQYQFRGNPLRLVAHPNRPTLLAILEYHQHPLLNPLQTLSHYCEQRNRYVHRFEGISELQGVNGILQTMRQILNHHCPLSKTHPFNQLNQQIVHQLDQMISNTYPR